MAEVNELSAFDYLTFAMRELCAAAAQTAAYPSWDDKFARKEVREVWTDAEAPMRRKRHRRVTVAELRAFTDDQRHTLGIGNWDETLRVLPLWMFNYVADGETLTSIDGSTSIKGKDDIDLDVRFGCIAFGFRPTTDGAKSATE